MRKSILVLGLSLGLLVLSGSAVLPQSTKEITEPITLTWHATSKVLPLGEGSNFSTFEVYGVLMSDEGKGLFHEATYHAAGSVLIEKGISKNYVIYGCYFLKNGDKVFVTQTRDEAKTGTPTTKGKNTIIGGTGKCTGIQGSWEYTAFFLRPVAQGILQGYHKHPIRYTLP
jgi:hypothetical protein